jgi:hypothetical protein
MAKRPVTPCAGEARSVLDGPWANAATRPLAEVAKCGYDWSSACNAALWTPAADTLLCRYATERATRKGRYTPFTLHPADLFDDDVAVSGSDQSSNVGASPDSTTAGGGERGGETCAQEDLPKLLLLKEVSQWQLSVLRPKLDCFNPHCQSFPRPRLPLSHCI